MTEEGLYQPPGAEVLDRLDTYIWFHGFEENAILWANRRAVELWEAESLESLRTRDFSDMSDAARARQDELREKIEGGEEVQLLWTFYPGGKATPLEVTCRQHDADQRSAMLVEARLVEHEIAPVTLRALEALRHTRVMVAVYDEKGEEIFCNPAHSSVHAIRTKFADTFVDPAVADEIFASALAGEPWSGIAQTGAAHREAWHQVDARRVLDPATGQDDVLVTREDITAKHAAQRAKDEFVAVVSHELRTPLTSIRAALGLLSTEKIVELDERANGIVDLALRDAVRLNTLVDDLLDTQKLAIGNMSFQLEPLELRQLVRAAVADSEAFAARFEIATTLSEEEGDEPVFVSGDPERLGQVLVNLITNAAKFSPEGGAVKVRVLRVHDTARVEVEDDGPGVPASDRERIFEPFFQVDSGDARAHAGSGLGLAIARAIIDKHGGSLAVERGGNGGSVFYFELATRFSGPSR